MLYRRQLHLFQCLEVSVKLKRVWLPPIVTGPAVAFGVFVCFVFLPVPPPFLLSCCVPVVLCPWAWSPVPAAAERRTCLPSTHQPLTISLWSLLYPVSRLVCHVWWIYNSFQAISWLNLISTFQVFFAFQLTLVFLPWSPQCLSSCLQTSLACLEAHSLPSPHHTILPASPPRSPHYFFIVQ